MSKRAHITTEANAKRKKRYVPTAQRTIINVNELKGSEKRRMRDAGLL